MKEIRMRALFGILGLAAAGFLVSGVTAVGCGSDNANPTPGTAGSTGSAGSQGTAGTTGGGGTQGGGSGGGGTTGTLGCQVSDLPPAPAPIIADFASTTIAIGGTFAYPSTGGPVIAVENGGMHVTATTTSMTSPQYWGVGIYFNGNAAGTNCVDGTQYTGIKFDISGTIGGTMCTGQVSINDSAHSNNATDPKGSGDSTVYAPQSPLTVTTAVATVMVPFTEPTGGNPMIAVDKAKLTGVQWQFTTAASGTCMVDIIIDNVSFY
jgi:hypothetical protein